MLAYVARRVLAMVPMLLVISFVSFVIIQLPPGDFFTTLQAVQGASGGGMSDETANILRERYGLDESFVSQYVRWVGGFLRGDFGYSFEWRTDVWPLIDDAVWYTIVLGTASIFVMLVLGVPIGIYSATHQYSGGDFLLSVVAFIGLSVPGFLLALLWIYLGGIVLGWDVMSYQSREFLDAPMSAAKAWDFFLHIWPPAIILGLASTAQLMRIMRNGMLDTMNQQYVTTARAKGLAEKKVINKYVVRSALNPVVSVVALEIPKIISSSILIGVVMSIPTTGPLFLRALLSQDMYVAGTFLMLMSAMLLVANLLADLILAWLDPRIVYA